eukprot:gene5266-18502_t
MKYGFHSPPQPNTEASFVLKDATGEVVSMVCPGQDYVLTTSFPQARGVSYLLTTTIGSFSNNYEDACPNQVAEVRIRSATVGNPLSIPADAAGTAMIMMTWARDFQDFYHQMPTSFEVNCGGGEMMSPPTSPPMMPPPRMPPPMMPPPMMPPPMMPPPRLPPPMMPPPTMPSPDADAYPPMDATTPPAAYPSMYGNYPPLYGNYPPTYGNYPPAVEFPPMEDAPPVALTAAAATKSCPTGFDKLTQMPDAEYNDEGNLTYEECHLACSDSSSCTGYSWTKIAPVTAEAQSLPDNMAMAEGWMYDHFCYGLPSRIALDGTNVDTEVPEHTVHCLSITSCKNSGYFISNLDESGTYVPTQDLTSDSTDLMIEYLELMGGVSSYRPNVVVKVWGEMVGDKMKVFRVQDAISTGMCQFYKDEITSSDEKVEMKTTVCVKKSIDSGGPRFLDHVATLIYTVDSSKQLRAVSSTPSMPSSTKSLDLNPPQGAISDLNADLDSGTYLEPRRQSLIIQPELVGS